MSVFQLSIFAQLINVRIINFYAGCVLFAAFSSLAIANPRWVELQQLAKYQQEQGDYQAAASALQQALDIAKTTTNQRQTAITTGALGNIYIALRKPLLAKQYLKQSIQLLETLDIPSELAKNLNNLGNYFAFEKKYLLARQYFKKSRAVAIANEENVIAAQAAANQARIELKAGDFIQAQILFDQALLQTKSLPNNRDKAFLLINLSSTLKQLESATVMANYQLLKQAADISDELGDSYTATYVWRSIGALYEQAGRLRDALQLTQKSLFYAQQSHVNNRYLLLQGHWQAGRLQNALGQRDAAIGSYRIAINLLQQTRYQMAQAYRSADMSFQESTGALYFQLADLLFQKADQTSNPQRLNSLLHEVRDVIELSKAAELRNYFDDECIDALKAKNKRMDNISTSAAIIYPILLEQRLELLVARSGLAIKRYTVFIGRDKITEQIRIFRQLLEKRNTYQYRKPAQQLYSWLIKPFITEFKEAGINTLVFVPDGALRTVPMAALFDGQQHLIEQYAVAVTPGIELTDPKPLSTQAITATVAGLTESVDGFPALKHVQAELEAVHGLYGGHLLINESFKNDAFKQILTDTQLNVLHIATHAQFKGTVEDSFLLTYDGRLSLSQLAQFVGLFKFRENPLELLVLSACETAQGDDQAALGLSGIAIKAGARSAIGSLWQANDAATTELMNEFYRQIKIPFTSRAEALQYAQLKLIKDVRYKHPAYWSAFLLINSWL